MLRAITLAIASSLCGIALAEAPQLPEPPKGFEWQWCEEVRAAFLRPAGWHFKKTSKGETQGYFITKEKIEDGKEFRTGLTVNVAPDVGKAIKGKASDYASAFVAEAVKDKKTVLEQKPPTVRGRLITFVYRIKKEGTVVHSVLVADNTTDKLYFVFFESPEAEWDSAWKVGEVILKRLYFEIPQ